MSCMPTSEPSDIYICYGRRSQVYVCYYRLLTVEMVVIEPYPQEIVNVREVASRVRYAL